MGRLIGYARVSTAEQDLALQLDALKEIGCSKDLVFVDKVSGAKTERPGLEKCLSILSEGDTLIVWRIDRLGRSMSHLVNLVQSLFEKKIGFKSLCDGVIDTTSASGELVFNIFSAMAQFERRLIQERTRAGLTAARARGRKGGRPFLDKNDPRIITAKKMHENKDLSVEDICTALNISRSTLYRFLGQ